LQIKSKSGAEQQSGGECTTAARKKIKELLRKTLRKHPRNVETAALGCLGERSSLLVRSSSEAQAFLLAEEPNSCTSHVGKVTRFSLRRDHKGGEAAAIEKASKNHVETAALGCLGERSSPLVRSSSEAQAFLLAEEPNSCTSHMK
jgi:hypothetical protein